MRERDWDDDSAYRSAVRRARGTMVVALVGTLLVGGVVAVGVFAVWVFLGLAESLSR